MLKMKNTFYTTALLVALAFGANAQAPTTQTTAKGVQCQIVTPNAGERIKQNDVITFQAVQKTDKDSVLFSTYMQGHPVKIQVQPSSSVGDLMDVFTMMTANDSAVVKVPVDSVFKGHEADRPAFLAKGGNIVFNVKILKVQTLDEAMAERNAGLAKIKDDEKLAVETYVKKNNLSPMVTKSGLRYLLTKPGTGIRPVAGDSVEVNYTGRTTDGKLFDTSVEADAKAAGLNQPGRNYEPLKFIVGTGRVIPGWDEGLMLLSQGSKAKFIIPSDLAYGERGAGEDIKPYSTLVFDVELVKVVHPKAVAAPVKAKAPLRKKAPLKKRAITKKKN